MDCPKCIGKLQSITLTEHISRGGKGTKGGSEEYSLEVDKCFSCGGVWFDADELDKYLAERITVIDSPSRGKDVDRRLDRAEGTCPRCTVELKKSPSSVDRRVTIDVCQECRGVWLDSTEIDRLERANKYGTGFVGAFFSAFTRP